MKVTIPSQKRERFPDSFERFEIKEKIKCLSREWACHLQGMHVENPLKYDCPWCGTSLKWRTLHNRPLFHAPYSTLICPECEGRLLRNNLELKNKAGWAWWNAALYFVVINVIIWVKVNRWFFYTCLTLYLLLTVSMKIHLLKRYNKNKQKYSKYTEEE